MLRHLYFLLLAISLLDMNKVQSEPKIAFLFLTRGHIPFEPIWREFFRFRVRPEEYSIYVHPQKNFHFRNTSFFHGKEINHTVETVYLKASVQEAERELLKAALDDKDNAFFCLLSESCIPLHPFQAMKHALFAAGKSLVNACRQGEFHDGMTEVNARWRPELDAVPGMRRDLWRKSLQQFLLLRKHAELVAYDTVLFKAFEKVPIPDEHYIPTLLAWQKMDNETTCAGGFAYVRFDVSGVHPKAFGPRDVGPHLFRQLEEEDMTTSGFSLECSGTELCHFTARKFLPEARGALLEHLRYLLTDTYRPSNEYPSFIQAMLRDVLDNGTILNSSAEKEKARLAFLPPERSVVKARSERSIFFIQNHERREIPNMRTFVSLGFDLDNVSVIPDHQLRLIPLGLPIPEPLS